MTIADFINHIGENYYGEIDELNFEDDNIPQIVQKNILSFTAISLIMNR